MAATAPLLTSEEVGRRGARSLRRKELPGRREHVLTAPGARAAEEEAEVGAAEAADSYGGGSVKVRRFFF